MVDAEWLTFKQLCQYHFIIFDETIQVNSSFSLDVTNYY